MLAKVSSRVSTKRLLRVVIASASAAALLAFSAVGVRNIYAFFAAGDEIDRRHAAALESLGYDNTRMLVAPYQLTVRYRYYHFPAAWAFPPNNQPTLELLMSRFDVGTLILDNDHPLLQNPTVLARLGFYKEQVFVVDGVNYVVYKRPAP